MLGAFADGEDRGIIGGEAVIDQDAAAGAQARRASEPDIRAHADGDDHEIGGDFGSVRELDGLDMVSAAKALGFGAQAHIDAAGRHRRSE